MRLSAATAVVALVFAAAALAAPAPLSPADRAAAFKAAGFKLKDREWVRCEDDPTASRRSGALEVADLNGDGAPEVWITEGSLFCYGNTAEAFVLLTRKGGGWTVLLDEVGVPSVRAAKRAGWPDIEVGGPGFGPSPVYRFDGAKYVAGR